MTISQVSAGALRTERRKSECFAAQTVGSEAGVSVLAASERINPEAFNSPKVEAESTRLELCIRARCLLRRISPHQLVPPRWPKCRPRTA